MASCLVMASLLGWHPFWPGGPRQPKKWSACLCVATNFTELCFPPAGEGRDQWEMRFMQLRPCERSLYGWKAEPGSQGEALHPGCLVCVEKWSQSLITLANNPFSQRRRNWKIRILLAAAGMFWTTTFELTPSLETSCPMEWKMREFHMSKNLKAGNLLWKEMKS